MSVKAQYTGVVVHRWGVVQRGYGSSRLTSINVLTRQDKVLAALFDKLVPLVQGGATLTVEQRVVNAEPVDGQPYDVIDITVTQ